MRKHILIAAAFLLAIPAASLAAAPQVRVEFVQPERYFDAGRYGIERERNLQALARHFSTQGERCLQPGQHLEVRVLGLDLAGRDEWWHRAGHDLRVMRDITWPRLELEFVWRAADGTVLDSGRERLADMSYLHRSAWVRHDAEPLPYEKAMLRDWFERRFCRRAQDPARSSMPGAP